ncbi:hypothetical protein EYC80_006771 [Monilinia laxa]|uniref:Uncharacterized protein n=1 Tax=Monilinia laxa TaxID=61186 RepID=A0A5N6JZ65_MONLA|nr:hypothetical protein EYC80_006771 [Monilinia laxa]
MFADYMNDSIIIYHWHEDDHSLDANHLRMPKVLSLKGFDRISAEPAGHSMYSQPSKFINLTCQSRNPSFLEYYPPHHITFHHNKLE